MIIPEGQPLSEYYQPHLTYRGRTLFTDTRDFETQEEKKQLELPINDTFIPDWIKQFPST